MKRILSVFALFVVCVPADSKAAKVNVKTVLPRAVDGLISHLVQYAGELDGALSVMGKIDALSCACDEYCAQRRMSESMRQNVLKEFIQRYHDKREQLDPWVATLDCDGDVVSHVWWDDEQIVGTSPVGRMHLWYRQTLRSWHGHEVYACQTPALQSVVQAVSADDTLGVFVMQPERVLRVRKRVGRSWREHDKLVGHTGMITGVCVNDDGTLIVSASTDRTIRVWKKYGERWVCSQCLIGHRKPVFSVSLNQQGTMVLSGSLDATMRIWRLYSPLEEVLAFFIRNIFPAQWGPYQELFAAQVHELSAGLR